MKKRIVQGLIVAIAVVGNLGMQATAFAEARKDEQKNEAQDEPRARMGDFTTLSADAKANIQKSLGVIVKQAVDGDFDEVVSSLAKPDRDRISPARLSLSGEQAFEQLRTSLEERYDRGIDWKATDVRENAFNYSMKGAGDATHAQVVIPAADGIPQVTLNFVDEGLLVSSWKLDIPDHVNASQLRNALVDHVKKINSGMQLPANKETGAKLVAHHVLAAVNGEVTNSL